VKIKPVKPPTPPASGKEKIPVASEPQSSGLNDAFAKLEVK